MRFSFTILSLTILISSTKPNTIFFATRCIDGPLSKKGLPLILIGPTELCIDRASHILHMTKHPRPIKIYILTLL